jgi:hypothetical protein
VTNFADASTVHLSELEYFLETLIEIVDVPDADQRAEAQSSQAELLKHLNGALAASLRLKRDHTALVRHLDSARAIALHIRAQRGNA